MAIPGVEMYCANIDILQASLANLYMDIYNDLNIKKAIDRSNVFCDEMLNRYKEA
jgi:hypothetical protein